ncbi:hypothetical protein MHBO_000883 [Bonamia ostreae]|uniref:Uncharacterized protein n=1 Tax=Bonamia ostreae TaxID=126728 RepID=A0ABV2AH71_9EUKA
MNGNMNIWIALILLCLILLMVLLKKVAFSFKKDAALIFVKKVIVIFFSILTIALSIIGLYLYIKLINLIVGKKSIINSIKNIFGKYASISENVIDISNFAKFYCCIT